MGCNAVFLHPTPTLSEPQSKQPGAFSKSLRLFAIILLVLLVPVVLDQIEVDPETVRLVGRVAGGLTLLLIAYSIFAKVLKVMAFVLIALLTVVVLMSEGAVKFPRLKQLVSSGQK